MTRTTLPARFAFALLSISLLAMQGCGSSTPSIPTLTTGPGTTINSGKSQCQYRIDSWYAGGDKLYCPMVVGQLYCTSVCFDPTTSASSTCPAGGDVIIPIQEFASVVGRPLIKCAVTVSLVGCNVCPTSDPDAW